MSEQKANITVVIIGLVILVMAALISMNLTQTANGPVTAGQTPSDATPSLTQAQKAAGESLSKAQEATDQTLKATQQEIDKTAAAAKQSIDSLAKDATTAAKDMTPEEKGLLAPAAGMTSDQPKQ